MMMVVPVDAQIDEAEHVTRDHGNEWPQRGEIVAVWHLQLQHRDRENDGEHAIAEGFQPAFAHHSTAMHSISTRASSASPDAPIAERAGRRAASKNVTYTSFIAPHSRMSAMNTVHLKTRS